MVSFLVSYRVCLSTSLHFEISSVFLIRILFRLNNEISSYSFKQRLHLNHERLKHEHFLRILHFILGTEFLSFIFQFFFQMFSIILIRCYIKRSFMVTTSFVKCDFCFTYMNALAVGLFIASDSGFVSNIFSLTIF